MKIIINIVIHSHGGFTSWVHKKRQATNKFVEKAIEDLGAVCCPNCSRWIFEQHKGI